MTRDELEHLLRASASIAEDHDVLVFGSQAILGSYDETELPDEAVGSIELDVCFRDDPDIAKADRVDGAIGELSAFHLSFGVYAQGISITTAIVPPGWEQRLVVYDTPGTEPGRGLCLEPHDLVASKLAAGRDKDFEFADALLRERLLDRATLDQRIAALPIDAADRAHLAIWLDAHHP